MGKLIKHELKGNMKFILAFLTMIVLYYMFIIFKYSGNNQIVSTLMGLGIFGTGIGIIIGSVNIFKRDTYGDTGYLLFTLPQNSYQILGYKIITSIIYFVIFTIAASIMSMILTIISIDKSILTEIWRVKKDVIMLYLITLLAFIIFIMIVYFSITICKSTLKAKKFKNLISFIIFIGTTTLIGKLHFILITKFPNIFAFGVSYVNGKKVVNGSELIGGLSNISFELIIFTILFMATGYLIEKKMDL